MAASSPEIGSPPENKPMGSPPPFPSARPPQISPQPTTADPLEPAQSDHAKPTPPSHPGNATATSPEAYKSSTPAPPPPPKDGTTGEAGRPPWLSAPPALEATKPEEPTSPLPPPAVEAATTEASPAPSPQIMAASAADTPHPPPSTPSSAPAPPPGALPDSPPTDPAATVSKDAARLTVALESMDANQPTTPTPLKPLLESGPEGLLPQHHQRPPCPMVLPGCENSDPARPPSPCRPPADIAHALPDTGETDAIAVTSGEPGASSAFKSEVEGSFEAPMPMPVSSPTEAGPGSPEMAPPGFEEFKSSWPPLPSPNLSVKTTHSLLNASMPEEASNLLTVLEGAMDARINTAPGLPPPSSGSLQQPLLRPPSPVTQAEPCSPDSPPPGFENFKLSRLSLPNETTYTSSHIMATKAETMKPEEAVLPVPALEAIHVETDSARSLLPPLESKVEGLLKQPLLRSTTPVVLSDPCSPEMAPPGFENFRSSWQPVSTPLSGTAHIMPDAAVMEPLAVTLEEGARPQPALEAMDVDMHSIHPLLVPLESGMEGSQQRPSSHTAQEVPCSPDMAPPGFENLKPPQLPLPSPSLAQTAYTSNDPATSEGEHVPEEAAQPLPAPEAMDVNMEILLESGAEGSLPQQLHQLPSPKEKGTVSSLEMMPSGHENTELLPLPPLLPEDQTLNVLAATDSAIGALDQVHPVPVLGTIEEGTSPILSPPLESGSKGLLPQLEPQMNSVMTHAVDTQPDPPATNYMDLKPEETALPPPALQAMDTNMDSATTVLLLSGNGVEGSSPQRQHQPSSPSMQAAPCSLDDLELPPPPPPPPFLNKEMGQMVCGSCRGLIAYPRGAVHVLCGGCRTINLVLEAHEVGNVRCGRCDTLLMYPFGAPAVKCSLCLFITNIGERNVRPRISVEQVVSPHPPELVNQGQVKLINVGPLYLVNSCNTKKPETQSEQGKG